MHKSVPLLAAAMALTACKADLAATLFTTDLAEVAATGAPSEALIVLGLETTSCEQRGPVLADAIRTVTATADFIGCRKVNIDTFAEIRIPAAIIRHKLGEMSDTEGLVTIGVGERGPADPFMVGLYVSQPAIEAVRAALPPEMSHSAFGEPEVAVSITVHNDGDGPFTAAVQGVFLDGMPYQLLRDFTLERRTEARIVLSDVGNAAVQTGGALLLFLPR